MARDAIYTDPVLAEFYDDTCDPARQDFAFCMTLARGLSSALDLGCGTGALAVELAKTVPRVVAVDPARAMLDIARRRAGSGKVNWILADATTLELGERFDLIVMTGNALQCLARVRDQMAVFDVVARHLAPAGRFVFDTRNPTGTVPWTRETTERRTQTVDGTPATWWVTVSPGQTSSFLSYTKHFLIGGQNERTSVSHLRFTSPAMLVERLAKAGLSARLFGGWSREPLRDDSTDIVAIATTGQLG